MNRLDLAYAINEIEDDYLREAEEAGGGRPKTPSGRLRILSGVLSAAAVLFFAAGMLLRGYSARNVTYEKSAVTEEVMHEEVAEGNAADDTADETQTYHEAQAGTADNNEVTEFDAAAEEEYVPAEEEYVPAEDAGYAAAAEEAGYAEAEAEEDAAAEEAEYAEAAKDADAAAEEDAAAEAGKDVDAVQAETADSAGKARSGICFVTAGLLLVAGVVLWMISRKRRF